MGEFEGNQGLIYGHPAMNSGLFIRLPLAV
jgi:hypothetical protein